MAFVQEGKHQKSYAIAHFSAIALAYLSTLPRERQYICAIAAKHQGISLLSHALVHIYIYYIYIFWSFLYIWSYIYLYIYK